MKTMMAVLMVAAVMALGEESRWHYDGKIVSVINSNSVLALVSIVTSDDWTKFKNDQDRIEKMPEDTIELASKKLSELKSLKRAKDMMGSKKNVLITGISDCVDDDEVWGWMVAEGVYEYQNAAGAKATVRKYRKVEPKK